MKAKKPSLFLLGVLTLMGVLLSGFIQSQPSSSGSRVAYTPASTVLASE